MRMPCHVARDKAKTPARELSLSMSARDRQGTESRCSSPLDTSYSEQWECKAARPLIHAVKAQEWRQEAQLSRLARQLRPRQLPKARI